MTLVLLIRAMTGTALTYSPEYSIRRSTILQTGTEAKHSMAHEFFGTQEIAVKSNRRVPHANYWKLH